jgi:hypothetical protein
MRWLWVWQKKKEKTEDLEIRKILCGRVGLKRNSQEDRIWPKHESGGPVDMKMRAHLDAIAEPKSQIPPPETVLETYEAW